MDAKEIISLLKLEPLPGEGGFFQQTYKSTINVPSSIIEPKSKELQPVSTAIYYLVVPGEFSALHRLKQDEIFHFYAGGAVEMVQIDNNGVLNKKIIGPNLKEGQRPQVVVPAGVWQGTRILPGAGWALLGTTCAPGFEFRDFELGKREELIKQFPQYEKTIRELTRA